MKKIICWVVAFMGMIILLPFIAFGAYFSLEIQPRIGDIRAVLATADKENLKPPQKVKDLIRVSVQPSGFVARLLVSTYQKNENGVVRDRKSRLIAWYIFVDNFYSQEEVFALFCTFVDNGDGQGLNELSIRRFGRPISELSELEAAELVAYVWAPGYMGRSRERLEKRRDLLIERTR